MGFGVEEMKEVLWGVVHHLDEDEILMYAKPVYYADQMKEIRLGLEDHLQYYDIEKYADFHLDAKTMKEIRISILNSYEDEDE